MVELGQVGGNGKLVWLFTVHHVLGVQEGRHTQLALSQAKGVRVVLSIGGQVWSLMQFSYVDFFAIYLAFATKRSNI